MRCQCKLQGGGEAMRQTKLYLIPAQAEILRERQRMAGKGALPQLKKFPPTPRRHITTGRNDWIHKGSLKSFQAALLYWLTPAARYSARGR